MKRQVLSDADVEQFIELGYIRVKQAYSREAALKAQRFLWDQINDRYPDLQLNPDDPSTWQDVIDRDAEAAQVSIHLREFFNGPEFKACETSRLAGAIEDLVGEGRWALKDEPHNWGWWPINFAVGKNRPWTVSETGWHWDGMGRKHFVDSPEQGLLVLPCFSDVGSRGGGTLLATGSHKVVARYLARHPEGIDIREANEGCSSEHPWFVELTGRTSRSKDRNAKFMAASTIDDDGIELQVIETIAEAGDVMLAHPFIYHAASQNHAAIPRFMCNRAAPLTGRMELQRSGGNYSVLEESVRRAIAN